MIDLHYPFVSFICAVLIFFMLVQNLRTDVNSSKKNNFSIFLLFSFTFALIDTLWSASSLGYIVPKKYCYSLSVIKYFAASAIACEYFVFIINYSFKDSQLRKLILWFSSIPFLALVVIFFVSLQNGGMFSVDVQGDYYRKENSMLILAFLFHNIYYYASVITSIIAYLRSKKQSVILSRSVIFYALIPMSAGIGELVTPYYPLFSVSYMVSAFVVYIFEASKGREFLLREKYQSQIRNILDECIDIFYTYSDSEKNINQLLEFIAQYYSAKAIVVCELSSDVSTVETVFKCNKDDCFNGVKFEDEVLKAPFSVIDSWNRSFSEKHEYVIKNVKDSYSAGDLFFDRFNVRQVMAVSFFHNRHLAGAIFIFDAEKNPTDVTVAKSVSFFIYCEILRKKFIENSEKTKGAVIEALAAEYASVFYIDVDSGAITAYRYNNVLKDTYYGQFGKVPPYSEAYQFYVDTFVIPSDADEMARFGSIQNLKNVLKNRSSVSKKYQAKTKSGVKYFEAKWVKIGDPVEDPKTIVLGFTDIDDRVHQQMQAEIERNIQKLRLDSALEQAEEATKESQLDKLTEIYNKISGMEIMNSYISEKPENEFYSIIFIDLDKFKNINDTYGHLEGDVILKGVGQIISKNSRIEDIAVRFGGDEFVILLRNICDEEIVRRKTDALAMEIAYLSYGKEYIVSCSIGAYITSSRDLEKSLDCADKLLYKIKKHGRDGVKIEKDKN